MVSGRCRMGQRMAGTASTTATTRKVRSVHHQDRSLWVGIGLSRCFPLLLRLCGGNILRSSLNTSAKCMKYEEDRTSIASPGFGFRISDR